MIPAEKYPEIAKGLLDKTRQGKVEWRAMEGGAFGVTLPRSTIIVGLKSSDTAPDRFFLLLIRQSDARPAGSWNVEEGDEHWDLATALYSEVSRRVTGWDKVLEDVEKFIAQ